jgi:hypothetical protein
VVYLRSCYSQEICVCVEAVVHLRCCYFLRK